MISFFLQNAGRLALEWKDRTGLFDLCRYRVGNAAEKTRQTFNMLIAKEVLMMKKEKRSFLRGLLSGGMSIRVWFTFPSLLLLLSIGIIGGFVIQAGIGSSRLILGELQKQMTTQVIDQLSQRLSAAMQLNQINYNSLQSGTLVLDSQTERERYFANHIKSFPDVSMSFIGLADGSFYGARRTAEGEIQVVRNNSGTGGASRYFKTNKLGEGTEYVQEFPNYDPRKRPWYQKAAEAGEPVFSAIYSHFVFYEPAVTAAYPVYDGSGHLLGVFGVDYVLSWLGSTLGDLPIGNLGQVFMTDETGMLIATSFDSPNFKMVDGASRLIPAKESESPLIQAALVTPPEDHSGALSGFTLDGKRYYFSTASFTEYGLNWQIHVILAEDEFLGNTKTVTTQTVVILSIAILLALFLAFWVPGHVIGPVVYLSKAAKELAKGNHIPIPDDGRKDELGELNRSFNEMGLRLTNMVAHLEEEVRLRTQELQLRNDELQQLSFLDSLTGIANRRQFDGTLKAAWNTALRYSRPIAIFMLDIDSFKNYNDTYGHQAGDDCLKAIGRLLSQKVRRASDLAARYGGEEFVVILQEPEQDKLLDFAQEIRKSVQGLGIEHKQSPYEKVTVSIGVACMIPTLEAEPAELVEAADRALYQAKQMGRNRVEMSGDV